MNKLVWWCTKQYKNIFYEIKTATLPSGTKLMIQNTSFHIPFIFIFSWVVLPKICIVNSTKPTTILFVCCLTYIQPNWHSFYLRTDLWNCLQDISNECFISPAFFFSVSDNILKFYTQENFRNSIQYIDRMHLYKFANKGTND